MPLMNWFFVFLPSYKEELSKKSRNLHMMLVRELHGEIVERVCRHMASKGLQTLPEIIRGSGFPEAQVRQALLLILQHNYASAYLHKEEAGTKNARPPYSLYEPHVGRMLQIIRYPRFLLHISEEMDEEAERIIEILLRMGRLSLNELVSAVAGRVSQSSAQVSSRVRTVFMSLVQSHYVERAPPCGLPPPHQQPHPESVKGRRGGAAKAGSAQAAQEQAKALRSIEELAYDKQRFRLPQDLVISMAMEGVSGPGIKGEEGEEDGEGDAPQALETADEPPPVKRQRMRAGGVSSVAAPSSEPAKGKKGVKDNAPPTAAEKTAATAQRVAQERSAQVAAAERQPSVILWRVNVEEFNRRFRHKACVDMVRDKIDADAAGVLSAMLTAARPYETRLKEERSATLSVDEVAGTARRLIDTETLPELGGDVATIIHTIAHDALELISYIGNGPGGEQYVVNTGRIVELVRLKQVEAVIRDRFGPSGLRIFRLLLLRGQLEQKQVTDFSMLSPKDTRELLYRMLRGGFLALQDIPRSSDRAPARTFYTWRANYEGAGGQLAGELYAAASRVWARMRHELDKEKELLELIEESRKKGEMQFTLTEAQKKVLTRLKNVSDVLESSLLQLDDMVAVFNEF